MAHSCNPSILRAEEEDYSRFEMFGAAQATQPPTQP